MTCHLESVSNVLICANGSANMKRPARLSASFVRSIKVAGVYGHGRGGFGLSLVVKTSSVPGRLSKSWTQRLRFNGRSFNMGLGPYPAVSFADAEDAALENVRKVRDGIDPRRKVTKVPTFEEAAENVIALHRPSWRVGSNSESTWRQSLRDYAFPVIGDLRVDAIDHALLLDVLRPIWTEKLQTAKRLRARLRTVLDWAVAEGYRSDNPAGDSLDKALPRNGRQTAKNRPALRHTEVRAALDAIRECDRIRQVPVRLALEFTALTALRPGEVVKARWEHVDVESRLLTVPAANAKTGRSHEVPLAARAFAVLEASRAAGNGADWVFPTRSGGRMGTVSMMRGLGYAKVEASVHGFRASFRSWCSDSGVDRELAESALAHVVGGVEGAYQRSTMLERRRELMSRWGEYVTA